MADYISDMMGFDNIADDEAIRRRDDVNFDTQVNITDETRPPTNADYFDDLRKTYGSSPPDQLVQPDASRWSEKLQRPLFYGEDTPPVARPIVPPGDDFSLPKNFLWNDALPKKEQETPPPRQLPDFNYDAMRPKKRR